MNILITLQLLDCRSNSIPTKIAPFAGFLRPRASPIHHSLLATVIHGHPWRLVSHGSIRNGWSSWLIHGIFFWDGKIFTGKTMFFTIQHGGGVRFQCSCKTIDFWMVSPVKGSSKPWVLPWADPKTPHLPGGDGTADAQPARARKAGAGGAGQGGCSLRCQTWRNPWSKKMFWDVLWCFKWFYGVSWEYWVVNVLEITCTFCTPDLPWGNMVSPSP